MTGEKDAIARAIYERRNGHGCKPWSLLPKAHKEPYLGDAEAAQALFAPLLAEKERGERNRDMWKGQCERQAKTLFDLRMQMLADEGQGRERG